MKLSEFDYNLPKELIANSHVEPRDHSRLLVLDRSLGSSRDKQARINHKNFYDIVDYLKEGDVLVFNNSKVFKARIFGKKETGAKIEMLLVRSLVGAILHCRPSSIWEVLVRGKVKVGDRIFFEDGLEAEIIEKKERSCEVRLNASIPEAFGYLEKYGELPLPPYVGKSQKSNPKKQNNDFFYQNYFASEVGSVAAPTAGFHFTPELLEKIKAKGVEIVHVTLHVGPGTFLPVESDDITKHKMHEEFFELKKEVWDRVLQAKEEGRRVIGVGTTSARVLESVATENYKLQISNNKQISNIKYQTGDILGSTQIFIRPPYEFKIVDALVTNFHLPKSTLLMLVSAFAGTEKIKKAYEEAVDLKYRFYSFGDSMVIF